MEACARRWASSRSASRRPACTSPEPAPLLGACLSARTSNPHQASRERPRRSRDAALADASAGDRLALDADERLTAAARPGLDAEVCELLQLRGIDDERGAPRDEHAPALAHRLVDLVDLEADSCACGRGERAPRAGTEEHVPVEIAEVDRQRHRALRREEDEAADAAAGEMQLAFLAAEDVEVRVRAGSSRPGRPVDVTACQE